MKTKDLRKAKGITLIALVVTIIVLLILAGVSIMMLTGDNGILTNAQQTSTQTAYRGAEERVKLAYTAVRTEIMAKTVEDGTYNPATEDETARLAEIVRKDLGTGGNGAWSVDGSSTAGVIKILYTDSKIDAGVMGQATIKTIGDGTVTDNIPREEGQVHYQINLLASQDAKLYVDTAPAEAPVAQTYTITYLANTGSGEMAPQSKTEGVDYTIAANGFTAPSGKVFKNWNTEADGEGTSYSAGATYSTDADLTLYAIYETAIGNFQTVVTNSPNPGDGIAYYYTGSTPTSGTAITTNPSDNGYLGKYLGMKVNYTPTGAKTVSSKTIGTGKNGSETTPTYRIFYIDVNGDYGTKGTIYLKADDDENYVSLSALDAATGTTKMEQFNKQWWADTTRCNNSSYADYNNRISVNKLLDPSKWTEYKDATGANQIANYVVGAPSLEMWKDSYNAFLTANQVDGYSTINCTTTPTTGTKSTNNEAGYFVGIGGTYGSAGGGCNTDTGTLVNPSSYSTNAISADRVEAWNKGSGYYWLASPSASNSNNVMAVYGGFSRVDYYGYYNSFTFCPLVSCNSGVAISEAQ